MLHQIIYCSRNRIAGSPAEVAVEIEQLLDRSRRNNISRDITGALLFNGEAFAQVLEGPRAAAEALYAVICADERHNKIIQLEAADIAERDFLNWAMAYSGAEAGLAFYEHLRLEECQTNPSGVAQRILALLKSVVDAYV